MTNDRKLELTLCGMLPYGLQFQHFDENYEETLICKVVEWRGDEVTLSNGERDLYVSVKDTAPLLHSLDKLTEPILEGGLIPIVVIRELIMNKGNYSSYDISWMKVKFDIELLPFYICEKLKEWHFNIYDLPKKMYIEKSEIK